MKQYYLYCAISLFITFNGFANSSSGYLMTTESETVLRVTTHQIDEEVFVEFAQCKQKDISPTCGEVIGSRAFNWIDIQKAQKAIESQAKNTKLLEAGIVFIGAFAGGALSVLRASSSLPSTESIMTYMLVFSIGAGASALGTKAVTSIIRYFIPGDVFENEQAMAEIKRLQTENIRFNRILLEDVDIEEFIGSLNTILIEIM